MKGTVMQSLLCLRRKPKLSRSQSGFTLIELMIVVVIIGILTAIAYPAYTSYVLRTRRSDAFAALAQDQTTLERCYAQNFAYNNAACPTSFPNSPQGYYAIVLSNQAVSTYTLTATPLGPQTDDTPCASISVDQANQKNALDSSGNQSTVCWNAN
jgi:type IV pilus assembly protein PilE